MHPHLFNELRGAVYNPRTDPDALRGYAIALVGEVEKLTDSVNRLEQENDQLKDQLFLYEQERYTETEELYGRTE